MSPMSATSASRTFRNAAKSVIRIPAEWFAARCGPHRMGSQEPQLWILMYHRILPKTDPRYALEEPGMIVEPETFKLQLQQLKRLFTIVDLNEWLEAKTSNSELPSRACAITFDDGWLDNYEYAFPILKQENIRATLFAVSDMIGTNRQFWPNQLSHLLQNDPNDLMEMDWLRPYLISGEPPSNRESLARIINELKHFPDNQLSDWLDSAQNLFTQQQTKPALMNWEQLREMADSGLVTVGSHTCNHFRLREDLPLEVLEAELSESKKKLEAELSREISLFCYPNGDLCEAALKRITEIYKAAVTTQTGINSSSEFNPYQLSRIGIHEDRSNSPRKFQSRLSTWL